MPRPVSRHVRHFSTLRVQMVRMSLENVRSRGPPLRSGCFHRATTASMLVGTYQGNAFTILRCETDCLKALEGHHP